MPSAFTIGLGYWDRQQPNSWSVLKTVTRIILHPSYDSSTTTNDIALMKLDVSWNYFYYIMNDCFFMLGEDGGVFSE